MTTDVIDTPGEVVEETTERLRPEDIPAEDIPLYTVAGAIEWMKRPENEAQIRRFSDRFKQSWNNMVQAIDRDVSKTGRLVVDMCADENVYNDVANSFLRSLVGPEFDD